MPKPPLILFAPDETPHLIDFSFISEPDHHFHFIRVQQGEQLVVHTAECRLFFLSSLMTVVGLIFNTRAVSRMPLPLRAMSIICSLISGEQPL